MRTTAANKRATTPSYGFTGISGRYYGDMVWSGADLGSGGPPRRQTSRSPRTPTTRTITQGQSTTYAFTVNATGGFNSQVSLSTSSLPSGVSASFSPNPATGSSTLTITTTAAAATGTTNITVTGVGGGLTRTVGISLTVNAAAQTPTPDFSLSSNPGSRTIDQGQQTTYALAVNATGGFNSQVSLSTSSLPSGVSASFSPNPATGSSTLTITTTAAAATGTTNITVTGVGGGLTRTVGISLTVNATQTAPADYTLSVSPASRSVTRSSSTTYTVTINRTGGFAGNVSFAVSGLPGGASASFSPNPASGNSATLTVQTTSSTPAGTSTLTITGTSGAVARSVTASLGVTVPWYCVIFGC